MRVIANWRVDAMTHPIPLTAVFEDLSSLRRAAFGRGAFLGRMEQLDATRGDAAESK
jgi:hypothetical protein